MATYGDFLNQFVAQGVEFQPTVPTTPSPNDAAALTAAVSDPNAMLRMNMAMDRGNSTATDNAIIQDYQSIPFWQFQRKYGPEIAAQMGDLAAGQQELFRLENQDRSALARTGDAASGVAKGLVGGIGDAGTFVAGALNNDAGLWTAQQTSDFRSFMDENQSQSNQSNRFLSSIRSELDAEDNQAEYERQLDDGKSGFESSLAYLGRGFVNGAARFWEDPQSLETGLAEGVGSLFAGGAIGKGVGIVSKLAKVGSLSAKAMMPATIGAMEGGSAYSGAVMEVMGMSHEDLARTSPTYRELLLSGSNPEQAREQVAARAGQIAGAIQAPIGALTGKLVSGFEANPLGSKGFRDMIKNIVSETVEEGIQGGTGQAAQNVGIQQSADENQMLIEGVGDQVSQGAILGSLTAGVVQTPAIPGTVVRGALNALTKRASEVQTANDAGSGVTGADLRANAAVATDALEGVSEAAETLAQAMPEDVRSDTDAGNFRSRIEQAITVKEEDVAGLSPNTSAYLQEKQLPPIRNRMDLMMSLAYATADETAPTDVRETAALFLLQEQERSKKLFNEDLQEGMYNLDQNGPEYQAIKMYSDILAQTEEHPGVKKALDFARSQLQVTVPETVTNETVVNAVRAATVKPSAIPAQGARTIMKQADDGNITVSPEQRKALEASISLQNVVNNTTKAIAAADKQADYETPAVKEVTEQILTKGFEKDWALSVDQHIGRINDAMLSGNLNAARSAFKHFNGLAQSQRNKAAAAVRSIRGGGKQEFSRLGSYGRPNPVQGNITIHANSPASLALGRRVALEANMLADLVADMATRYPEVDFGTPTPRIDLAPEFFGDTLAPAVQQAQAVEPEAEMVSEVIQTETPVSEPVEPSKQGLEKSFPLLVKSANGLQRFLQAFNMPKTGLRMLAKGRPLAEFIEATKEPKDLIAYVGEDPKFDVDGNQREALGDYLELGRDIMTGPEGLGHRLRTFAALEYKSEKRTWKDRIVAGVDVAGHKEGKAIAILEKTERGYQYNPALMETAVLAALNWFAQSQNREAYLDKQDVANLTGLDISEISNKKVEEFNSGVGQTQVVRGLAQEISLFWGLEPNKNAPQNDVLGIPEAIAKEILNVMKERGFFTMGKIKLNTPKGVRNFNQYYFGENTKAGIRNLMKDMGPAHKLIGMAALTEANRNEPTYNNPPTYVAPTQMRNKAVENTKFQRKVIRAAQKIPFYFYENSYDLQRAITKNGWISLMGSTVIGEDTVLNKEHLQSVKGKNLTISNAFDALEKQVDELKAYGDNPAETKKFYQFNYSRVNRLQMLGVVNPQSDKIARHVFLPTKTTVDMNNEQHTQGFWMAVAQGLGAKTQNFTPAELVDIGMSQTLEGKYSSLVQELADWLKGDKKQPMADWANKLNGVDNKITEHGVMSLLSVAEYLNAKDAGTLNNFTTYNYFEADGVTNGAANALMNLSTEVTADWIDTVRKGGAFIGAADKTMVSQKDTPDLYKASAQELARLQRDFSDNLPDNVKPIYDSLFNIMRGLNMEISIAPNGEIEIGRKVLKNPLTITIYGSGVDGIAGNVADELVGRMYEAISDHLQKNGNSPFGDDLTVGDMAYSAEGFWNDLYNVLNNVVSVEDNVYSIKEGTEKVSIPTREQLRNLSISPEGFNALRDNVRVLFVNKMDEAIKSTVMGHVGGMVDRIQQATNAQSIVMNFMFRKELLKAMADRQINPDKYPNYRPGDFLSQAELDTILKSLMPYGAVINTENQSFFLGSGERGDLLGSTEITIDGKKIKVSVPEEFARDLGDKMQTSSYTFAPKIAGVAGVPSFNIGTGDGRMIDLFIGDVQNKFGFLPVFDGINIPIDRIMEGSLSANTAVATSWTENPAKYAAESFKAFLRQNPLEKLFDQTDPYNFEMDKLATELSKNAAGVRRIKDVMLPADIQVTFEQLMNDLDAGVEAIADRIEGTKAFPMAVDQMAGGSTPFVQQGSLSLPADASSSLIATALEAQIRAVRKARAKQEAVQAPSREFVAAFRRLADTDPETSVLVAGIEAVDAIRKSLNNKLSNANREMLNASIQSLKDSGLKVVFGSPDMIERYEMNNYPDSYDGSAYLGKIDVENNVIFLTNPSAETLSHELLHAATIVKMQGYYSNKKSVSQTDGEAIQRMEGLMKEWLAQSYEREGPGILEAHRMATSAVLGKLNQGKMAEAVNEFLAWSLSNQNIINLQKKMQVKNPAFVLMGKALTVLKQLIWGHKKAPEIGNDMFSNVRFNARLLMATPTPVELFMKDFGEVVLYQSSSFGSDNRLSDIRQKMAQHIFSYVNMDRSNNSALNLSQKTLRRQDTLEALLNHAKTAQKFSAAYHFDMQQASTFKMIGATLSVVDKLNSASLARMQDVFSTVIDKITVDDFLTNQGDPGADRYQAQMKYDALTGVGVTTNDRRGRTSLLPNFIALATVDNQFRSILRGMTFPARVMNKSLHPDDMIQTFGSEVSARLAAWASGEGKGDLDLQAAMDALTQNLIENVGDQRSFIEQRVDNGFDNADRIIKTYIEKGVAKSQKWAATLTSPLGIKAKKAIDVIGNMLTEDGSKLLAKTAISNANLMEQRVVLRELLSEVIGRTDDNAPVFDMISKTRTFIDQTRQRWREEYPKELRARFTRKLSKEEWGDLHYSLGKTDAGALFATYRQAGALELLSSGSRRQAEIALLEGHMSPAVLTKAKQLAEFMLTGKHGPQLQRNAHAIATLNKVPDLEQDIDNLVSLYALESLTDKQKAGLEELNQKEKEGLTNLYASVVAARNDEMGKTSSRMASMNAYKGYLKGENQEGVHLFIGEKSDHGALLGMSYEFLGDYQGSSSDISMSKKGYYFAPVSGKAKYNQGVMQTVRQSQFGVDPETGYSIGEIQAGRVTDPQAVAAITRRIQNQTFTKENLLPIYNENGGIVAYERAADPDILSMQNPTYDLAVALGAWRGRQTEELAAQEVNKILVDNVHKIWMERNIRDISSKEFVAMDKAKDPVIADAWLVIPKEAKDYIKSVFGNDGFMVRRDMLLDVAGARSATVGDFWTGNSRWSPTVQKEIRDAVIGMFGNKAYRYLVNSETTVQNLITDAKVLIVIKSVIVPAANLVSNVYQLSMNGVPIRNIFKGMRDKTVDLNKYIQRKEQERQLQNDLFVAEGAGDGVAIRKLSTRLQALKDSYRSLSIWPLIEAGEFGAITDGGITPEDLALSRGGYAAMIDKLANKLPEGIKDVARYGMITRDTELFKALSRATQYGDFISKAVLFDDLINRKKMSQQEAIAYVSEEFVNYNRFAGRNRAYLESIGMTWFYNFKLRSMKTAQRMLHKHPVRALLHSALTPRIPLLGSVGNPMTDNMLSVIMEGRLGYSTGPSMLFRAPQLNPWLAIID